MNGELPPVTVPAVSDPSAFPQVAFVVVAVVIDNTLFTVTVTDAVFVQNPFETVTV